MSNDASTLALKASLEAFFDDVAKQKTAVPPPPLLPHFAVIDRWLADHDGGDLHPRLRHFLQNKSYQKALHFLEGKPVEGH